MAADWLPSWRRSSKRRSWSAEIDPVTIPDDVRKSLRPDRGRRGQSRFEDCVSHHPAFLRSCSSSRRSPLQPPLFCRLQKLLSEPLPIRVPPLRLFGFAAEVRNTGLFYHPHPCSPLPRPANPAKHALDLTVADSQIS